MSGGDPMTKAEREALRGLANDCDDVLVVAPDLMLALLDAADERDRLAEQLKCDRDCSAAVAEAQDEKHRAFAENARLREALRGPTRRRGWGAMSGCRPSCEPCSNCVAGYAEALAERDDFKERLRLAEDEIEDVVRARDQAEAELDALKAEVERLRGSLKSQRDHLAFWESGARAAEKKLAEAQTTHERTRTELQNTRAAITRHKAERAFDAGRLAEREDVVGWLRDGGGGVFTESLVKMVQNGRFAHYASTEAQVPQCGLNALAYAIEDGSHLKTGDR